MVFAEVTEFADEDDPREELLFGLGDDGRCGSSADTGSRVWLTAEDVVANSEADNGMIDADGFACSLCPDHARILRAITESRACSGPGCVSECGDFEKSPCLARVRIGRREAVCVSCFSLAETTGAATPSRQMRAAQAKRAARLSAQLPVSASATEAVEEETKEELERGEQSAMGSLPAPATAPAPVVGVFSEAARAARRSQTDAALARSRGQPWRLGTDTPSTLSAGSMGSSPVMVEPEDLGSLSSAVAGDLAGVDQSDEPRPVNAAAPMGAPSPARVFDEAPAPPPVTDEVKEAEAAQLKAQVARLTKALRDSEAQAASEARAAASRFAAAAAAATLSSGSLIRASVKPDAPTSAPPAVESESEKSAKLEAQVAQLTAMLRETQLKAAEEAKATAARVSALEEFTPIGKRGSGTGVGAGADRATGQGAEMFAARAAAASVMDDVRGYDIPAGFEKMSPADKLSALTDGLEGDDRPPTGDELARLTGSAHKRTSDLERLRAMIARDGVGLVNRSGMDTAVAAMTTYARGISSEEVRIMLAAQLAESAGGGGKFPPAVKASEPPAPSPAPAVGATFAAAVDGEVESDGDCSGEGDCSEEDLTETLFYKRMGSESDLVEVRAVAPADARGRTKVEWYEGSSRKWRLAPEERLVRKTLRTEAKPKAVETKPRLQRWTANAMWLAEDDAWDNGVWLGCRTSDVSFHSFSDRGLACVQVEIWTPDVGQELILIEAVRLRRGEDFREEWLGKAASETAAVALERQVSAELTERLGQEKQKSARAASSASGRKSARARSQSLYDSDDSMGKDERSGPQAGVTSGGTVLDFSDGEEDMRRQGRVLSIVQPAEDDSSIGPSASQVGAQEVWRRSDPAGANPYGVRMDRAGMTHEEVREQVKTAMTGLEEITKAPLHKELHTLAESLHALEKFAFRQTASWVLRGCGSKTRLPSFAPLTPPAQLPSKLIMNVGLAAVSKVGKGSMEAAPYPYAIVVDDFAALAWACAAFGFDAQSQDAKILRKRSKQYFYSGRTFTLSDVKSSKVIEHLEGWRFTDLAQGRSKLVTNPKETVARPEVLIGGCDPDTMLQRMKAYARMFEFYFEVDLGLKDAAQSFFVLASKMRKNRYIYPVDYLCLAWEHLMYITMMDIRRQLIDTLESMESLQRDTQLPNLWNNLKMDLRSAKEDGRPSFYIPDTFKNIVRPDGVKGWELNPESHLAKVWDDFMQEGLLELIAQGVESLTAGPSKAPKGHVGSAEAEAESQAAGAQELGDLESKMAAVASAAAKQAAEQVLGAAAVPAKPSDKPAAKPSPKKGAYPWNCFDKGYSASDVNSMKMNLGRSFWQGMNKDYHALLKEHHGGKQHCFASATHAGCGSGKAECDAEWVAFCGCKAAHGALPQPLLVLIANDPKYESCKLAGLRGGGLMNLDKKILPIDVLDAVAQEQGRQAARKAAPDPGSSGVAGLAPTCTARSTLEATGGAGGAAVVSRGNWKPGRHGRLVPGEIADHRCDDREAPLDAAMHAPRVPPPEVEPGKQQLPRGGLGEMYSLDPRTADEQAAHDVGEFLSQSVMMVTDLVGQPPDVLAYARARAAVAVRAAYPDAVNSGAAPDELWSSVRDEVVQDAAKSSMSALSTWASGFSVAESDGHVGSGSFVLPPVLAPGEQGVLRALKWTFDVFDHGEMLAENDGGVEERCKCLFLAVGAAVGVDPALLLREARKEAKKFLESVGWPIVGSAFETLWHGLELAHDVLSRDHAQMRAMLVWFAHNVLADREVVFLCCVENELQVEVLKGAAFSGDSSKRGWVLIARQHAQSCKSPVELSEFLVELVPATGRAADVFVLAGYDRMLQMFAKRRERKMGRDELRPASSLHLCEFCPSDSPARVRCVPRRWLGSSRQPSGDAAAAPGGASEFPTSLTLSGGVAEEAMHFFDHIDASRRAVVGACEAAFLGGAPPDFVSGASEHVGGSGEAARAMYSPKELRDRNSIFKPHLKFQCHSMPFRFQASFQNESHSLAQDESFGTVTAPSGAGVGGLSDPYIPAVAVPEPKRAKARGPSPELEAKVKAAVQESKAKLRDDWTLETAADYLVELWTEFPDDTSWEVKAPRLAMIEFVSNAMVIKAVESGGSHVDVVKVFNAAFRQHFGHHLSAERIEKVNGLTKEVRDMLISVATAGVGEHVTEQAPRSRLRLKMNSVVAEEHGKQAVDKVIKDGRHGRVLLISSLIEEILKKDPNMIMVCKMVRVAKRFLSGAVDVSDARFCNAQIDANKLVPSKGVGPGGGVKLPRVIDVCRLILRLAFMFPGLEILLSKYDVNAAFKLVPLAEHIVGLFAASIPRWAADVGEKGELYVVLLVLSFGSSISPGYFDYFSKAISHAQRHFSPSTPETDGTPGFSNEMLVDDAVLVEVAMGDRTREAAACCRWAMRMLLGWDAVNEVKGLEEALFELLKIVWGLLVDTTGVPTTPLSLRVSLPPVKREKAATLAFDERFHHGSFDFGRWQVQVLGGNMVFWAGVCPLMWPLMRRLACNVMTFPDGPDGPSEPTKEEQLAYSEAWAVVELLRVIVGSQQWSSATFSGSVGSLMDIQERLMYEPEGLIWLGGDANMNGVAAGSWSDGVYCVFRTADWQEMLKASAREFQLREVADDVMIAIWELMCFIVIATNCAENWRDRHVLYVSDNMLVRGWLETLHSSNPLVGWLLSLVTLLMNRFRFGLNSVYIDTEGNPWDQPSRCFDPDDVRKSDCPSESELPEYMAVNFPDLELFDGSEAMRYYLQPGGVAKAYELFGMPDVVAVQLASARGGRAAARSAVPLLTVGLYSGSCALEREWVALGHRVRAVGEWAAASRAVARLDIVGEVEFFEDVTGDDHLLVAPTGVESCLTTASCVDYSTAGEQLGLDGRRAWQVVDSPRKLLHFEHLLGTLVENVQGWITANDGRSYAAFCVAMGRLRHQVVDPVLLDARNLGMSIQSARAMVFTNRVEFKGHLRSPEGLGQRRVPAVPLKRRLLPFREVAARRSECEVRVVRSTWQAARVSDYSRAYGPVQLGSFQYDSIGEDGLARAGALVRLPGLSNELWRVVERYDKGRARLRSGAKKAFQSVEGATIEHFRIKVYSLDGQAFRVTASDIAEPPLRQSKAAYLEDRGDGQAWVRILLAEEGWFAMGKRADVLKRWRERAALQAADAQLPRTVPPYTATAIWSIVGNSVATEMAKAAVSEHVHRVSEMRRLRDEGVVVLEPITVKTEDELYDPPTLRWRARTFARQPYEGEIPERHGIDDKYLNVAVRAAQERAAPDECAEVEQLLSGAHVGFAEWAASERVRRVSFAPNVGLEGRSSRYSDGEAASEAETHSGSGVASQACDEDEALTRWMAAQLESGEAVGAQTLRRTTRAAAPRERLRPDHMAASKSRYGTAKAGEDEDADNALCAACGRGFFSASGKSEKCPECRTTTVPARTVRMIPAASRGLGAPVRAPMRAETTASGTTSREAAVRQGAETAAQAAVAQSDLDHLGDDASAGPRRSTRALPSSAAPRRGANAAPAEFERDSRTGSKRTSVISEMTEESRYELDMRVEWGGIAQTSPSSAAPPVRRGSAQARPSRAVSRRAASAASASSDRNSLAESVRTSGLSDAVCEDKPLAVTARAQKGARGGQVSRKPALPAGLTEDGPRPPSVLRNANGAVVAGPQRPPAKKVRERRKGLALLGMEAEQAMQRGDYRAFEDFAHNVVPLHSVAYSTLRAYESGWKKWISFQWRAQRPVFLPMNTSARKLQSCKWVLTYMSVSAFLAQFTAGTIKGDLMSIRFFHLAHSLMNPLEEMPRIWQAYRAIRRISAATNRKQPTTHSMHRWLNARDKLIGTWDALVSIGARMHGAYLGPRSGEFLGGPPVDWAKVGIVADFLPMEGQRYVDWQNPNIDGYMRIFRSSKTDQFNEGAKRYCGATGTDLCSVQALKDMYAMKPEHFSRSDAAMFTMSNGKVMPRELMQADLRKAAVREGITDPKVIGTHSLRVTCATWLYQAGYDIGYIKRHGRWTSDVVHVYLWEGEGRAGVAEKMAKADYKVHAHLADLRGEKV